MEEAPAVPQLWLRLADAAKLAKVSEKTIRNWADARRIGKRKEKGIALYSRRDLELLGEKNTELALVRESGTTPLIGNLLKAIENRNAEPPPQPLQIEGIVEKQNSVVPVQHWELWLTYDRAVAFSGLGLYRLQELVKTKKIRTERGPHGSIVLSKADLESWGSQ